MAVIVVDKSAGGAVYKGIALASNGDEERLYATDFHNARVDVFNGKFEQVSVAGGFADPRIPEHFAPFGIRNINGDLYVTYALQDAAAHDDVAGPGFGFVDVFDADGHLIRRVASRGRLNAPWGLALAPADFGKFSGRLLVGNFGDGKINAFDLATDRSLGPLRDVDHHPIVIDGLWGLSFGNGFHHQPINALFFAAGPNDESDGLFGRIEASPGGGDGGDDDDDD